MSPAGSRRRATAAAGSLLRRIPPGRYRPLELYGWYLMLRRRAGAAGEPATERGFEAALRRAEVLVARARRDRPTGRTTIWIIEGGPET